MQASIDNAKRQFDIDIADEIKRIKNDMDIDENGYPEFWKLIKRNFKGYINKDLHCPMNYLCNIRFENYYASERALPTEHFFNKFDLDINRKTCLRVEELIVNYSLSVNTYNSGINDNESYLLLRSDFDNLLISLRSINISKNYLGLMSWLIDRAFVLTPQMKSNSNKIESKLKKNRSLLLKVLYDINKQNFLKCFDKKYQ